MCWMDAIQQWSDDAQQYVQRLEREYQEVKKENSALKEKIKDLEKRLAYYENAHKPPSSRKLPKKKKQDAEKSSKTGKRGAPNEENKKYTEQVKICNKEDSTDYCVIQVSLAAPVNRNLFILQFFQFLTSLFMTIHDI